MNYYMILDLCICLCCGYLGAWTSQKLYELRKAKEQLDLEDRQAEVIKAEKDCMRMVDVELWLEDIILKSPQLEKLRPFVINQKRLYTGDSCVNSRFYLKQIQDLLSKEN